MAGKTKKKASEKKGADQVSIESYKNKIVTFLKANGKKTMPVAQLETKCRTKKNGKQNSETNGNRSNLRQNAVSGNKRFE